MLKVMSASNDIRSIGIYFYEPFQQQLRQITYNTFSKKKNDNLFSIDFPYIMTKNKRFDSFSIYFD